MDAHKEKFLRNEFLTLSVNGALGRSRTYSKSATEEDKNRFRNALREKLDETSALYKSAVTEKEHLSIIENLSNDLTLRFHNCLNNERFRIGIAQKALNLYLKYLWCVKLVSQPPHCPFDSIVIRQIPNCSNLSWTSIDSIEDYMKLVKSAKRKANGKSIAEWELNTWMESIQTKRYSKIHNGTKRTKKSSERRYYRLEGKISTIS